MSTVFSIVGSDTIMHITVNYVIFCSASDSGFIKLALVYTVEASPGSMVLTDGNTA